MSCGGGTWDVWIPIKNQGPWFDHQPVFRPIEKAKVKVNQQVWGRKNRVDEESKGAYGPENGLLDQLGFNPVFVRAFSWFPRSRIWIPRMMQWLPFRYSKCLLRMYFDPSAPAKYVFCRYLDPGSVSRPDHRPRKSWNPRNPTRFDPRSRGSLRSGCSRH